jgi:plastocyanin
MTRSNPNRPILLIGSIALALVLSACSTASAQAPTDSADPSGPTGPTVSLIARDLAFTTPSISVSAGVPVTIDFDNEDGAPHNIAVSDATGASVFKGDIVSGQEVVYRLPALAPGTYPFICEVHPDMKGTITAE